MKKKLLGIFSLFTLLGFSQTPVEGFETGFPVSGWGVYQNDISTETKWRQTNPANPTVEPAYERIFATFLIVIPAQGCSLKAGFILGK